MGSIVRERIPVVTIRMASHLARSSRILQANDIYENLDARMRIIVICHS